MDKHEDLVGKRFGKLVVIARAPSKNSRSRWWCKCDCGRMKKNPVDTYTLKSGGCRSCGCLYKEVSSKNNMKHGGSKTRLYRVWSGMKQRCNYKKAKEYSNYGGRGIHVCDEWNDYGNFEKWAISHGYEERNQGECTIDRIDVNKDYCPENCRFVNMVIQNNNRRNNLKIEVNGVSHTAREWSEITGIKPATIVWRAEHNWSDKDMFIPANLNNKNIRRNEDA